MAKVHLTGYDQSVTTSVGSFTANLPELLGAMAVDPRCLVAVAEFVDERYVQFWVKPNGTVISEVISNLNIGDAVALNAADEDLLREMGWSEPTAGPNPNWHFESSDVAGLISAVRMIRHAVLNVLDEATTNVVSIRTWSVQRRASDCEDYLRECLRVSYQDTLRDIEREIDG